MSLSICPWKYGKRWVYSITYDEALADLHRFAVPMHEEYCRRYGYLGAMSLTDALNLPEDELFWTNNRTALHDHYYAPFYSAYDPYRNILRLRQVEAIEIHHLVPRLHEVAHEHLLRIATSVNFRDGSELGV